MPGVGQTSRDYKNENSHGPKRLVTTVQRQMRNVLPALLVLWLAAPARAQTAPPATYKKERVTFRSDNLTLVGVLFKPDGPGPFPGLIWNHGSEKDPNRGQFDAVAAIFGPAGYVVFAPMRRGHGESEGRYILDELQRERQSSSSGLLVRPMEGEQLDDQLAGQRFLRSLPYVDPSRLVVAGCSYGAVQTLLAAERGAGYKAAVVISPAAGNPSRHAALQDRLVRAVRKIEIPVFLIRPPKDYSLEPSRVLGREFRELGKPYTGKIYPAEIPERFQTHCFGGVGSGIHIWARDVLAFLTEVLR